ncbi:MAG: hypothetical protein Kow00121_66350 [Elainellaceae cyanobacterium]
MSPVITSEKLAQPWYTLSKQAVVQQLDSHLEQGLTPQEAAARLRTVGANQLTQKATKGPIVRFLLQFNQPLL